MNKGKNIPGLGLVLPGFEEPSVMIQWDERVEAYTPPSKGGYGAIPKDDPDYPVIVDAGVGTASDAAVAMELGATAVLMNTGIAGAKDPLKMARAMRLGIEAGHLAYESGRMPRRLYAAASSPLDGIASF